MSQTVFQGMVGDQEYRRLKDALVQRLESGLSRIQGVKAPLPELKQSYEEAVKAVGKLRGRDLFYPYIGSGAGHGPFVELGDGSVKYDLITGIGVNFFGHGHMEMFKATFDSLWCDVMQGNLGPNPEYVGLLQDLVGAVGPKSRLKHAWLTTCGATANETALKIIRQKKSPATRVFAFKDCFAGRTTALQEITDNAAYRQGQPTYGEVHYLSYFDPKLKSTAAEQAAIVVKQMKEELARNPGRYAMLEFELVQGEGGFNVAPREFMVPILQEAKAAGLGIWDDEVQTFGRCGEVFCFQRQGLDEFIDVVTVGKMLQNAAVLYTEEYNPKPGLVSGTFAGSSASLRAAQWVLHELRDKFTGTNGRIAQLEKLTVSEFERLKKGPVGKHVTDYTVFGGMIAFTALRGTLDDTKKLLFRLFENGVVAFYCGHGPHRVRMLPPFGIVTDTQWKEVFSIIEKSLGETAKELGL